MIYSFTRIRIWFQNERSIRRQKKKTQTQQQQQIITYIFTDCSSLSLSLFLFQLEMKTDTPTNPSNATREKTRCIAPFPSLIELCKSLWLSGWELSSVQLFILPVAVGVVLCAAFAVPFPSMVMCNRYFVWLLFLWSRWKSSLLHHSIDLNTTTRTKSKCQR